MVIVIISMLVGLLTPALISARGRARIAQCTNNQHELALAITQYDVAKHHLPGYINLVHGTAVSWVPVLFPFLDRNDLWEGTNGWPTAVLVGAAAVLPHRASACSSAQTTRSPPARNPR